MSIQTIAQGAVSVSLADSLPEGLTPESAYGANDGPDEQCRADLRAIIKACDGWPTEAAARLKAEAEEFLAEREA